MMNRKWTHLALCSPQYRWQPPALPRVHQQKHRVVLVEERLEHRNVLLDLPY